MNLLSNAAKYTPRGGHVVLEAKPDGEHAIIRVRDDGVGIAKDVLGTVFELFVQSKRTLDRAEGGLGLGLTLVRSLVDMHGGTVAATSDGEGRGAEFVVRFPLVRESEDKPLPVRTPKLRAPHGSRVVVVEDNDDSRDMLCTLLKRAGFDCRTAHDGPTGLALIENMNPDIAIIDLGLPGMNGFDIARRLRRVRKPDSLFLIALTGYGQAADRKAALEAGFDEHLVKPVEAEVLLKLLSDGARGRVSRSASAP
jgi:two-component system CheB/CheR fusion protein